MDDDGNEVGKSSGAVTTFVVVEELVEGVVEVVVERVVIISFSIGVTQDDESARFVVSGNIVIVVAAAKLIDVTNAEVVEGDVEVAVERVVIISGQEDKEVSSFSFSIKVTEDDKRVGFIVSGNIDVVVAAAELIEVVVDGVNADGGDVGIPRDGTTKFGNGAVEDDENVVVVVVGREDEIKV
uniref:Uncharacterized protein n=1 Tax=Panagrolaimus sp. ES5 TaxID=591445 RepID=A0AC34F100_9BILA